MYTLSVLVNCPRQIGQLPFSWRILLLPHSVQRHTWLHGRSMIAFSLTQHITHKWSSFSVCGALRSTLRNRSCCCLVALSCRSSLALLPCTGGCTPLSLACCSCCSCLLACICARSDVNSWFRSRNATSTTPRPVTPVHCRIFLQTTTITVMTKMQHKTVTTL